MTCALLWLLLLMLRRWFLHNFDVFAGGAHVIIWRRHEGGLRAVEGLQVGPQLRRRVLAQALQLLVKREVAVLVIAKQGEPRIGQMHADLVSTASLEFNFNQTEITLPGVPALHQADNAMRGLTLRIDAHTPLAILDQVFVERLPDMLRLVQPAALDQRKVALAHPPFAEIIL